MAQIIISKKSKVDEFPFQDEVHDMADFILEHPNILGADIQIICRELQVGTSNEARRIDYLVYDTEVNQVGIVELKNKTADEKVLLQTLRYANWIRNNPDTVRYQIKKQDNSINPEDVDTETIKIIIVAPQISHALTELSQYITAFEFDLIELQRFKDESGEVYAITNNIEVETAVNVPGMPRSEYDLDWFKEKGVRPKQMEVLKTTLESFEKVINENEWELRLRFVKGSARFQTYAGRNAVIIDIRKTQSHHIRFALGAEFNKSDHKLASGILDKLHHRKPDSRWWQLPSDVKLLNEYVPLMEIAYRNVAKLT